MFIQSSELEPGYGPGQGGEEGGGHHSLKIIQNL